MHCPRGRTNNVPRDQQVLKLLHQSKISSFLVTNAQFPAEIRNLKPVTQLYVSVDASTKESLKKIDRPLFKDFWQRFLDSLKALAAKQQRTVYRLTLVKAWNVDELQAYAQLVFLGNPDFIEVKGVTYCGESSASSLTMAHVPWHEEVVQFVRELVDLIPDYEIACEHEHSNCLLIAHKSLKLVVNGGRGSIITASRSSSRNMKIVVDQKRSVQRIIWPELLTGHYLVPMKEALIPRTQDIRERTNQRLFLDVEII